MEPPQLLFFVNGRKVIEKHVDPEMMLLPYLRKTSILCCVLPTHRHEVRLWRGGCGACTVMVSRYNPSTKTIRHHPVNACLTPICSLHSTAITTVEGIGSTTTRLHPIQVNLEQKPSSRVQRFI